MEDAERRLQAAAARERLFIFGVEVAAAFDRRGVAFGATARNELIFAIGEVGRVRRQRRL